MTIFLLLLLLAGVCWLVGVGSHHFDLHPSCLVFLLHDCRTADFQSDM